MSLYDIAVQKLGFPTIELFVKVDFVNILVMSMPGKVTPNCLFYVYLHYVCVCV